VGGLVDGGVEERFVVDRAGGFDATACGDDRLRGAVVDTDSQFIGRKAAENDGMDRAKPGAGEHRLQRLGDHRHVDDDPVALLDALGAQRPGEAGDAVLEFRVGDDVLGPGDGAVMDDGRLFAAPRDDMAVDGVPAGVDGGVGEPFVKRRAGGVERAGGFRHPVDAACGREPETLGIVLPAFVDLCVAHRDLPPPMSPAAGGMPWDAVRATLLPATGCR
jgi:hypothetical protein